MVIFENMIKYNFFQLLFLNKIPQPLPHKSTVIATVKLPIQDGHHGFLLFTGIWLFENRYNSLSLRVVPISQFLVCGSWTALGNTQYNITYLILRTQKDVSFLSRKRCTFRIILRQDSITRSVYLVLG